MAIEWPDWGDHISGMKKRLFAAALWFYAAWTFGSMVAWALGLGVALGPIFGVVTAGFILRSQQLQWRAPAV